MGKESVSNKGKERQNIKALIVEDDENFRFIIQECLRGMDNFFVDKAFAEDVKGALAKFKESQPEVVLLDIGLPDGSGLDLIKPMLQLNPMVGIIMVTGSRLSTDVNYAKSNGAIGYILKPYTRKKIENALQFYLEYRELLEKDEYEGESAAKHVKESMNFFIGEEVKKPVKAKEAPEEKTVMMVDVLSEWNILFVDGYKANAESAEKHLKKFCKHVDVATNSNEFKQLTSQKDYQFIFMDPLFSIGDDGYKIANEIKSRNTSSPIQPYLIALLPNQDELKKNHWSKAKMDDYILKPCSIQEINKKLNKFAKLYKKLG